MPPKSKRQRGIEAIQRLLDAGYTPDDFRAAIDKLAMLKEYKDKADNKAWRDYMEIVLTKNTGVGKVTLLPRRKQYER